MAALEEMGKGRPKGGGGRRAYGSWPEIASDEMHAMQNSQFLRNFALSLQDAEQTNDEVSRCPDITNVNMVSFSLMCK